jgi:cytochrome c
LIKKIRPVYLFIVDLKMVFSEPFKWRFFPIVAFLALVFSCDSRKKVDQIKTVAEIRQKNYIRKIPGEDDPVPQHILSKGEVLIAYSGCYDCHKLDKKSKGPAFTSIAKRYPIQPPYRDLLARKIISGGFGSWGNPVMAPHPHISMEDAQTMVYYILSLDAPSQ